MVFLSGNFRNAKVHDAASRSTHERIWNTRWPGSVDYCQSDRQYEHEAQLSWDTVAELLLHFSNSFQCGNQWWFYLFIYFEVSFPWLIKWLLCWTGKLWLKIYTWGFRLRMILIVHMMTGEFQMQDRSIWKCSLCQVICFDDFSALKNFTSFSVLIGRPAGPGSLRLQSELFQALW